METKIPQGYETVSASAQAPDGYEVVPKISSPSISEGLVQAGKNTVDILKYNASKLGAGVNAGIANLNEAIGVDSSMFRENQAFYQDAAHNADTALDETYADSPILKTVAKEAGNPINYAGGGMKTLAAIVLGDSANKIATEGDMSGIDMQDVGKVADDTSTGIAMGKAIDTLFNLNPKKALLGSEVNGPEKIARLKEAAKQQGVELSPASITGSPNLARLEHSISDGVAGGMGMRQALNKEYNSATGAVRNKLNSMGANGSNANAGEVFSQGVKGLIEREKQFFNDTFDKLFAKYGDSPVFSTKGVKNEANKLLAQAERNPLLKNQTVYSGAKAISNTDDFLSWDDWSSLRTILGGLTQDTMATGKASTGAYKKMYSELENDLKSSAYAIGDSGTVAKYDAAIELYKRFKQGLDGKDSGASFMNSVVRDRVSPEVIGHMVNNSTLKADNALKAGGWDKNTGLPMAKKVSATDTLMSSMIKGGDDISLSNFLRYSDRDGFKKISEAPNLQRASHVPESKLLGDDVVPVRQGTPIKNTVADSVDINELREVSKAIVAKSKYANNSKTAQYNMLNAMKMMNPVQLASFLVKEVGVSALYRNDIFKSWISKGIIDESILKQATKASVRNAATNSLLGENSEGDN